VFVGGMAVAGDVELNELYNLCIKNREHLKEGIKSENDNYKNS